MTKKEEHRSLAQIIGAIFAIIQGLFDVIFDFIFKTMRSASKEGKDDKAGTSFFKKVGNFIGELGESYYDTYEEMKARKKK